MYYILKDALKWYVKHRQLTIDSINKESGDYNHLWWDNFMKNLDKHGRANGITKWQKRKIYWRAFFGNLWKTTKEIKTL